MRMLGYAAGGGVVGMVAGYIFAVVLGYFGTSILGLDSKDGPLVVLVWGPMSSGVGLVIGACLGLVLGSKSGRSGSV